MKSRAMLQIQMKLKIPIKSNLSKKKLLREYNILKINNFNAFKIHEEKKEYKQISYQLSLVLFMAYFCFSLVCFYLLTHMLEFLVLAVIL